MTVAYRGGPRRTRVWNGEGMSRPGEGTGEEARGVVQAVQLEQHH